MAINKKMKVEYKCLKCGAINLHDNGRKKDLLACEKGFHLS